VDQICSRTQARARIVRLCESRFHTYAANGICTPEFTVRGIKRSRATYARGNQILTIKRLPSTEHDQKFEGNYEKNIIFCIRFSFIETKTEYILF